VKLEAKFNRLDVAQQDKLKAALPNGIADTNAVTEDCVDVNGVFVPVVN